VCELLRQDAGVRQLTLAAGLGIHSLTGVRERSNNFLHLFFERLHKVRQSQIFGDFFGNICLKETVQ